MRDHWPKLALLILALAVGAAFLVGSPPRAAQPYEWFVAFDEVFVGKVPRSDVTQLVDAGTIETDGFRDLVFSLGGEFKERPPAGGTIGAILLPDAPLAEELLRNEGVFAFPLEVRTDVAGRITGHIFVAEQQTAKIAFPAYRVYFYNETGTAANVSLYAYRTR